MTPVKISDFIKERTTYWSLISCHLYAVSVLSGGCSSTLLTNVDLGVCLVCVNSPYLVTMVTKTYRFMEL